MQVDRDVRIGGWIKTGREAGGGSFAFLEVNDGSCLTNLQVHPHLPAPFAAALLASISLSSDLYSIQPACLCPTAGAMHMTEHTLTNPPSHEPCIVLKAMNALHAGVCEYRGCHRVWWAEGLDLNWHIYPGARHTPKNP